MLCPSCGVQNAEGVGFCSSCGSSLTLACSTCKKELPPQAQFCDSCGTPVADGATQTLVGIPSVDTLPASFASDRYTVKELLGKGAAKEVYGVHDTVLDRDVAFALINSAGLTEEDRQRILREAQTMARLGEHPNIVQIYDFGEENGHPYMVMPLMSGGTIEPLVKKADAAADFDRILSVISDVCRGLDFAHSKDVIHRDLKPGNIWMTDEGVAKIGDFGIAFTPAHTRVTQTGIVMGTVAYMPPEQGMGRPVDGRSDLYSLGAMLYELVTGHRPFEADHPVAVISLHINAEPAPPTTHNPVTSAPLEGLIMRLLAKDPDERYQSAAAVLDALEAIAGRDETAVYAPAFGEMEIKPIRVLIMQESVEDTEAILAELRKGAFEPTHGTADSALTMAGALESQEWDLIITEYSMPNFSAPAGLKVLEMNGLDVPFIIVSHAITEEIAVAVLKGGAHDYVMKNNLARLVPAVQRELREAEVREERRRVEGEQLRLHESLEQRVRELTALNRMFQTHQQQRAEVGQAARVLFESLQNIAHEAGRLSELTSDETPADLQEVLDPDSSSEGAAAAE